MIRISKSISIITLITISLLFIRCSKAEGYTLPYDTDPDGPMGKGVWTVQAEFNDEFNSTSLDPTKWLKGCTYWSGRTPSQFNDDNVIVNDGSLQIKASVSDLSKQGSATENWIWTGCVSSKTMTCWYGYYEARIKASKLSTANAFWFQSAGKSGNGIEIDVTESIGISKLVPGSCNKMNCNVHDFRVTPYTSAPYQAMLPDGKKSSDDFFIYGVLYEPNRLVFYLNNKKVYEKKTENFDHKMFMYFDMEAFTWEGLPTVQELNGEGSQPTFYIDWVRSYKRTDVIY